MPHRRSPSPTRTLSLCCCQIKAAAAVRTLMPGNASFVYSNLGRAYQNLGNFNKAIEYQTQRLAIAKEVGDRAGEGAAYGNLGNAYESQGDFGKAIKYRVLEQLSHSVALLLTLSAAASSVLGIWSL